MLHISSHLERANLFGKVGKQVNWRRQASFFFHDFPTSLGKLKQFRIISCTNNTATISLSHHLKDLENRKFSSAARTVTSDVSNIPAFAIAIGKPSPQTRGRRKWLGDEMFLRSLKIYKGIYKHIEVPINFIIPNDSNWPEEYHDYKLGEKVALLRRAQRYIASDFKSELDSLGFIWKPFEHRFHKVDLALRTYKKLHGDLKIRTDFVIPSDSPDWPEMLWGYRLGAVVQAIRANSTFKDKRKYLEELGFIFPSNRRIPITFVDIKKAITVYKKKHDTCTIQSSFIIDQDDVDYAPSMRGVALGRIVFEIVHRNLFPENKKEVMEMGIQPLLRWQFHFNRNYEAMQIYKKIYGSLSKVPRSYIIPEGSAEFPSHLWGIKLGQILDSIKHTGTYKAHYDKLRELGVPLPIESANASKTITNAGGDSTAANNAQNTSDDSVSAIATGKPSVKPTYMGNWPERDTFLKLVRIYKGIYKHIEIPVEFVIPNDSNWPVEYHGYKLGDKVSTVRRAQRYIASDFKSELDSLGFIWNAREHLFNKAFLALQTYKKLHGDLKIKNDFVVPLDSPDWPEMLWGYRLGGVVQTIRRHNAYGEKRKYLEELGFIYEKQPKTNFPFADIKKAIEVYKARYRTFDIPYHYTIGTDDKDFPKIMRGAKLGVIVRNILHNNQYSQHHKKLEKMGMQLLPKMQLLFNRYYEAMQIYKKIYGSLSNVPSSYIVREGSAEFPPHLWGIKLGQLLYRIKYHGTYKAHYDKLRELGVPLPSNREKEENSQ